MLRNQPIFENDNLRGNHRSLYNAYAGKDRGFLDLIWNITYDASGMHLNRTLPVDPFVDENILKESQGEKGEWN